MKKLGTAAALLMATWGGLAQADVVSNVVTDWNAITLNCVQGPTTPANRGGPAGLLDIALVQATVHDAVQAIERRYEPYYYQPTTMLKAASVDAAAASAAYHMLVGLYKNTNACLTNVTDPAITYPGDIGVDVGQQAAAAMLPLHRPTMVLPTDPFTGGTGPGEWRPTPGTTHGLGTFLAYTAPFAMKAPNQFRPAPPPHLKSLRYARDYYEVKKIGAADSAVRTSEQTDTSRFWSVNFFSQWFEAVRGIAQTHVKSTGDSARLFALVAFAAADSQISVYEAKYVYNLWRPITAIHHGNSDGNIFTAGDSNWTPLIPTPAYPEYSSGANCLSGAITSVLQRYFNTDKLSFSVRSTASNLTTNPRLYQRISDVNREMVEVRIWQGIHFRTAEEAGLRQGQRIGRWAFNHYLRPIKSK